MSIADAMAKIDKQFGAGSVQRMGDTKAVDIGVIPTGSIALDRALGIGGFPRGRIVEIYGPESSGKTTVALHAVANAQKVGIAAYIDTEHALDPKYARDLGVDVDNMLISQPDTAEEVFEIAELLIDSGELSILVIDSIAACVPRRELEGDYGDSNVGLMARLMSQAMRKLVAKVSEKNVLLICINQIRYKIGVMFGSPETTTGGQALKFYASQRLDVRRIETEKTGAESTGNRTKVKIIKNKLAAPMKIAEFSLEFGVGISRHAELVDLAVDLGLIKKSGSWMTYGEQRWQGRANAIAGLKDAPGVSDGLEIEIREALDSATR